MKPIAIGILLVVLASAAPSAQPGTSARDEVLAAQKRFYEAYRTCNVKEIADLVTDDLLYVYSVGFTHKGKPEFLKSLEGATCGWDVLQVDATDVRVYGDTAVLIGDFRYKGKNRPAVDAKLVAMQVFVKRNGKWLFAANATSEAIPLGASQKLK